MDLNRVATARSVLASSRALVALTARSLEQAPQQVTLSQWRALVLVHTRSGQRQVDIATDLGLSASSTSRLVERLERKGLLSRRPSATSRRAVELRLTPAGEELAAQVLGQRLADIETVLDSVAPDRWPAMQAAFAEFALAVGEPVEQRPPPGAEPVTSPD